MCCIPPPLHHGGQDISELHLPVSSVFMVYVWTVEAETASAICKPPNGLLMIYTAGHFVPTSCFPVVD